MKNKLKGLTLLETVLYIGLFSIILFIVLNFMFSTQEASSRTSGNENLYRAKQFISEHINYTLANSQSIDDTNSSFNIDVGKLVLNINSQSKVYELIDGELVYDGIPISSPKINVERFFISPINKDTDVVGIKIEIDLRDSKNPELTEQINLLSTFR